jgi:hypothetical protein
MNLGLGEIVRELAIGSPRGRKRSRRQGGEAGSEAETPIVAKILREIFEQEGAEGIRECIKQSLEEYERMPFRNMPETCSQAFIDWINQQMLRPNPGAQHEQRQEDKGLLLPDWQDRAYFEALKEYIFLKLVDGRAGELSEYMQALAAQIISGDLKPYNKKTGKKPHKMKGFAIQWIDWLEKAEIARPLIGDDWKNREGQLTGCELLADILHVPEDTVAKWWKSFRKAEKIVE